MSDLSKFEAPPRSQPNLVRENEEPQKEEDEPLEEEQKEVRKEEMRVKLLLDEGAASY
jgi:hypothetical protein